MFLNKKYRIVYVGIEFDVAHGFGHGWLSVGTSIVKFATVPTESKRGVQLKAAPDNTGNVYIGGPDVTADKTSSGGFMLAPGDSLFLPIDRLENIYLIGDAVSQHVCFISLP